MNADQIRLGRPTSGLQRLEARFGGHAYDLHRHETYGIGLTLYGVPAVPLSRQPSGEPRRGRCWSFIPTRRMTATPARARAFAYRMLYVDPAAVSAGARRRQPAVSCRRQSRDDAATARVIEEAFADFPQPLEPLAVDAMVGRLADRLARRGDGGPRRRARQRSPSVLSPGLAISSWHEAHRDRGLRRAGEA